MTEEITPTGGEAEAGGVATPEDLETQTPEEGGGTPPEGEQVVGGEKDPSRAVKRINKLTARAKGAEEENERLRAELSRVNTGGQPPAEPQASQDNVVPAIENYSSLDDYNKDVAVYNAREAQKIVQEETRVKTEKTSAENRAKSFEDKTYSDENLAKYEDFVDVAYNAITTSAMNEAILVDSNGHDVLYYLGSNPQIADHIRSLPERQQAMEIGRISASFGEQTTPPAPGTPASIPAPARPGAPAPIVPISGAGSGVDKTDLSELSGDEYVRQKNKELGLTK